MRPVSSEFIRYDIGACGPGLKGLLLVADRGRGLCAILMGDDEGALVEELAERFPRAQLMQDEAELSAALDAVQTMLADPSQGLDWPLDPFGTEFQLQVWQALRQIPPGQTVSYTELAARIGKPEAVRAVASACAANPLAVVVPCHRVIRSDGGLSGYRWGVERKQSLLEREGRG